MKLKEAQEIAASFVNDEKNKSVIVTSDHGVYLNSPADKIAEHCKNNKLEMFIIKGEGSSEETGKKEKKK